MTSAFVQNPLGWLRPCRWRRLGLAASRRRGAGRGWVPGLGGWVVTDRRSQPGISGTLGSVLLQVDGLPRFCCRARGGSEGGLSHLQEHAFIGSSVVRSAYGGRLSDRRHRLPGAVETGTAPSSARSNRSEKISLLSALVVELAGVEPASSTHLRLLVALRPTIMLFTAGRRKPRVNGRQTGA